MGKSLRPGRKKAPNGYYDPADGSIHIDLNAGQSGKGTMLFTVAHELAHFIKDWSSVKYMALADALVKQYQKRGVPVSELVDNQIRKAEQNGREMSRLEAFDEMVADSMESMLTDENAAAFLERLAQRDKGLKEKIVSWLKELAAKLKNALSAYKDVKPDSPEGKMVAEMEDFRKEIMGIYTSALVDAGESFRENGGNKKATREGDVKNSVRETDEGIKYVVLDGNLFVDKNGKPLSPKQAYNSLVGQKITLDDGDVITFVKNIPGIEMYKELFKKYPGYDGSFDIVGINWDINKNILDVVSGSMVQKRNEPQRHYHYGISDFDQRQVFITDGNEVYRLELNIANLTDGKKVVYVKRYIEKADYETAQKVKKAETAGKTRLNQPSGTSIRNPEQVVKKKIQMSDRDSDGRQISDGQREYFKDSVVRDDDGKLIPVYHSTHEEFYTFKRDKLGGETLVNANDASLAATSLVGHWFSDHDISNRIGGHPLKCYLKITRPYRTDLDSLAAEIGSYIEARQIYHILHDHGPKGTSDHSMDDPNDIARIGYTLDDPDDIRESGTTKAYTHFKNGKNRLVPTVLYEKSIGDKSYYVVQAVPDTKAKILYVVSAFIGKSGYKKGSPAAHQCQWP